MTAPSFARPIRANAYGKCDERLDIPVTEDLKDKIGGLASIAGVTKAEYVRVVLERHVYGEFSHVRSLVHGRPEGDTENIG